MTLDWAEILKVWGIPSVVILAGARAYWMWTWTHERILVSYTARLDLMADTLKKAEEREAARLLQMADIIHKVELREDEWKRISLELLHVAKQTTAVASKQAEG